MHIYDIGSPDKLEWRYGLPSIDYQENNANNAYNKRIWLHA